MRQLVLCQIRTACGRSSRASATTALLHPLEDALHRRPLLRALLVHGSRVRLLFSFFPKADSLALRQEAPKQGAQAAHNRANARRTAVYVLSRAHGHLFDSSGPWQSGCCGAYLFTGRERDCGWAPSASDGRVLVFMGRNEFCSEPAWAAASALRFWGSGARQRPWRMIREIHKYVPGRCYLRA